MPKQTRRVVVVASLIIVAIAVLVVGGLMSGRSQSAEITTLELGTGADASSAVSYRLETVRSSADQVRGLSGRESMPDDAGMLFAYSDVAKRCLWMKDMRFNLDMVWLDGQRRIVSIVQDISPSTYPQSYCADAQYVIELNAGQVAERRLRPGQIINF